MGIDTQAENGRVREGTTEQSELFRLEDVEGFGVLTRKERVFVQEIFAGLSQREAARAAGIEGHDAYLDVAGSRLIRSEKVQRVLNQAWHKSGANIDETLRQAAEIARRAMNDWRHGETPERRAEARKEWKDAASLIAGIHAKLKVEIDAQVKHSHELQVAPEALPILAQMRRDTLVPSTGGSN